MLPCYLLFLAAVLVLAVVGMLFQDVWLAVVWPCLAFPALFFSALDSALVISVSFVENDSVPLAGFALGKAGAIGYHAWKQQIRI